MPAVRTALPVASGLAAVVGLSGCAALGLSTGSETGSADRPAAVSSAPQASTHSDPQPTPIAQTPAPKLTPSADAATPRAGRVCQPSQLSGTLGTTDAALGARFNAVTITNTSEIPCTVQGFPTWGFVRADGKQVGVKVGDTITGEPAGRRVELKPGARATAMVQWRNDLAAANVPQATAVTVIPGPGSAALPLSFSGRTLPLDIVQDTTVRLGPWKADS
ncbi:DUF4232 domain-containing protein [Dermacoccaceae bacterium W4C1]